MSWSPIHTQLVDSSLWHEPYFVRVLFTSLLALKDKEFIVRSDTFKLSSRLHMPEMDVIEGLKILKAPDTRRKGPQPFEGRRIEELPDGSGWFIINAEKYRDLIGKDKNKKSKAEWMAKDREQKKFFDSLTPEQKAAYLKTLGVTPDQLRKDGRPTARAVRNAVNMTTPTPDDVAAQVAAQSPPDPPTGRSIRKGLDERMRAESEALAEAQALEEGPGF